MRYKLALTNTFKRDYKKIVKRNYNISLLENVVDKLLNGEQLPESNKDHALKGEWIGYRECHIQPDWLLVYKISDNFLTITLSRTGKHSDLDF